LLGALLSFSSVLAAAPLDKSLSAFSSAVKREDIGGAIQSLDDSVVQLEEINKRAGRLTAAKEAGQEMLNTISLASKVVAQEPVELAALVKTVEKDAVKLGAIKPSPPEFGDPLRGASKEALQSTDPSVRGRELDKVRHEGDRLHDIYEKRLAEFKGQRQKAVLILKEAEVLYKLESGPASVFLNIGGGKLTYILGDMLIHVRPALGERLNAARGLVKRYDAVISTMETTLSRYDTFDYMSGAYRVQDWLRANVPSKSNNGIVPSSHLGEAENLMAQADRLARENAQQNIPSPNAVRIRQLADTLVKNTTATEEQARDLIREAQQERTRAAAIQEFFALTNLAGAISGNVHKAITPQSKRPLIINNRTTNWYINTPYQRQ
jgi:hypothetical protein